MKTAGVRELKARLSFYLREVEHGEVVLVTDRGRVVAELGPPGTRRSAEDTADASLRRLIAQGRVRPASTPQNRDWIEPVASLPRGTAQALIDAERGE
jgi:antitoxin (DNA-binding transcriptional repressor) of toxin-antitoxin stability system